MFRIWDFRQLKSLSTSLYKTSKAKPLQPAYVGDSDYERAGEIREIQTVSTEISSSISALTMETTFYFQHFASSRKTFLLLLDRSVLKRSMATLRTEALLSPMTTFILPESTLQF